MFTQLFRRFAKSVGGNVAVITALTATPMAMATGIAVDFGRQAYLKSQFDTIADTISLQAVDQAAMSMTASAAQTLAQTNFNKLATQVNPGATVTSSVVVTTSSSGRKAVVTYTASIPSSIMGIFGTRNLTAGGTSVANSANSSYIDVYVLADNTPSMGFGATTADVDALHSVTATYPSGLNNCSFACHDRNVNNTDGSWGKYYNNYDAAKAYGVTLRIDSVRNAINSMLSTANALPSNVQSNMRFAIYNFGADATTTQLTPVYALNSNIAAAQTANNSMSLMTVPYASYNNDMDTTFSTMFNSLNGIIPNAGDGSAQNVSRKLLLFISDGLEDGTDGGNCIGRIAGYPRCIGPLDYNLCTQLKNRGIIVATIYTTVIPDTFNGFYNSYVAPVNAGPYSPSPNSQIAQAMNKCASPGFYQEVGPNDSITATINSLFNQFISKYARITG